MCPRRTHCADCPLMNVHKLKVKMRTLINALNSHKSFIRNPFNHSIALHFGKSRERGGSQTLQFVKCNLIFRQKAFEECVPLVLKSFVGREDPVGDTRGHGQFSILEADI